MSFVVNIWDYFGHGWKSTLERYIKTYSKEGATPEQQAIAELAEFCLLLVNFLNKKK